ncbi:MAG: hypothetical protein GY811_16365 [Myxococcales bacterium]|nr:hypothetical protein [Myxococcales bacterium]
MLVDERTVALSTSDDMATASDVGWFAAKQPGLLRFVEDRVGQDGDATAMAVDLCWKVVAAFEHKRGLPMPRIHVAELELAEEEVVRESQGGLDFANGCAHRQPDLCRWLEAEMTAPILPVMPELQDQIALAVASTISACDRAHHPTPIAIESDASAGVLIG